MTDEQRYRSSPVIHVVQPSDPTPAEAAELAGKLVTYALDLCEQVGLATAVMALTDALHVVNDEDELAYAEGVRDGWDPMSPPQDVGRPGSDPGG